MKREVLALEIRLLGADPHSTLNTASKLAISLFNSGQRAETGQLLRDTLDLCLSALVPSHEQTLFLTECLRNINK